MLRTYYDALMADEIPFFVYNYRSRVVLPDEFYKDVLEVNLLSGSFNPVHDMHRLLYNSMKKTSRYGFSVYEMCIVPRNKPPMTFAEMSARLSQFKNEPIVVTNCTYFREKVGAMCKVVLYIHMGFDTGLRLYEDDGFYGIQGIDAHFIVYPRDGVGIESLPRIPYNFTAGVHDGEYINGVSSTKIRNENT